MASVNVNIQPEILKWVLEQIQEENIGSKLVENIKQWLDGTKTPTFNQIESLSKKSCIPLGYFFLQTPPKESVKLLEYRTVNSMHLATPSRNLIDTIHEMENIQDWMRSYREELGYEKLEIAGSMRGVTDAIVIADKIRKDLGLKNAWYKECKDARESFNYIRRCLEACGVIVMMSGVVGKNTHRALDVEEFRAFALADEWAPLIFINTADSLGAKLFSLIHEIAHIWIGENDLYNDRLNRIDGVSRIEIVCNAVAGEILVPAKAFREKWMEVSAYEDVSAAITAFARYFHCGESVIARKAFDSKKISKEIYVQIVKKAIDHFNGMKQNNDKSGGNYYNTMGSRLDGCFVRALCESVNMGRTSYTEAYRLTNTSRKTFSDVVQSLGGVEW